MENKKITLKGLEEEFHNFEEILDNLLLKTYQRLYLLKDKELIEENNYLIEAEKNIKSFGRHYREITGYDVAEPPVYGKIVSRVKTLKKLLVNQWEERRKNLEEDTDRLHRNDEDQDWGLFN